MDFPKTLKQLAETEDEAKTEILKEVKADPLSVNQCLHTFKNDTPRLEALRSFLPWMAVDPESIRILISAFNSDAFRIEALRSTVEKTKGFVSEETIKNIAEQFETPAVRSQAKRTIRVHNDGPNGAKRL
jgi:hypothetical protein